MGDCDELPVTLDSSKSIEITGMIMVIAIISLFVVVVVVLFLHLVARVFWWRALEEPPLQERNHSLRRHGRQFGLVPGQDNGVLVGKGLDPAVLCSIPVVVYRQEDIKEGLECAVCLCDVAEGEKARILPKCSHGFHVECIDMWFQSHTDCPMCRNSVASDCILSDSATGGGFVGVEGSSDEEGVRESDAVASHFPVNKLLFWGEARVSSRNGPMGGKNCQHPIPRDVLQESSSSLGDGIGPGREEAVVIEIPRQMIDDMEEPSISPSTSGCPPDEMKSLAMRRLRSFRSC